MTLFLSLLLACSNPASFSADASGTTPAEESDSDSFGTYEWYPDADRDGSGDASVEPIVASGVSGSTKYVRNKRDCDDTTATVHPGATELCNDVDDNCDGVVDNAAADQPFWYLDVDGDGFGTPEVSVADCDGLSQFVNNSTDCDDTSTDIHPGAPESCNSTDDDCDGEVDEDPSVGPEWYFDRDGDGRGGEDEVPVVACERPSTDYANGNTDCDDANAEIHPSADELCDEVDNDCDGDVDDHPVEGEGDLYYPDFDLDGFGSSQYGAPTRACSDPLNGSLLGDTDCTDYDPTIFPGATEVCNSQDDNCDGTVDEGIEIPVLYTDFDKDGYGNPDGGTITSCPGIWGYVEDATDCDDTDVLLNPGVDTDRDGYNVCDDCDDYERTAYPDAAEVINGIDDNCDGTIDEVTAE